MAAALTEERPDRLDVVENSEAWVFKDRAETFRVGPRPGDNVEP